jgi:hypothetical protein
VSVGGVLSEAWGLYTRFFTRFFTIAIIVYLIVNLVGALIATAFGNGAGVTVLLVLIGVVISLVGTFWLQGALVYAVDDVRDGRIDTTVGQIFERVRPYLGTLIGAGLLAGLGIALGFVLVIIPGLVLLTWWCLIVPVIVLEQKPIGESFGASRELVRGHGWTVFGIIIVTWIVSAIASGIIEAIFSFLNNFFQTWIGGSIASAIVGPFLAIALTLTYFKLRELRAGEVPEASASQPQA